MFFIGVFGIEQKEKKINRVENITCKCCNRTISGELIKSYQFFHFFFIPIFKWSERFYLICNNCNMIYTIPLEKGKKIETGEDSSITYWDLNEAGYNHYRDNNNNEYSTKTICKRCGEEINESFKYCPNCGGRV